MKRSYTTLALAVLGHVWAVSPGVPVMGAVGALALAGPAVMGLASPALAAPVSPPEVVEQWLLPRYDTLVATTKAQQAAWQNFCKSPSAAGVPELKSRFAAVSDAWSAVEFITFGPVMLSLRPERFNLFPERRNAVGRSVAELIAEPGEERLQPARFQRLSAAVQGVPALERVLYDDGAEAALLTGPEAQRRCMIGQAVADNLANIAQEVREGWGGRDHGLLEALIAGRADPVFFPEPSALLSQIVTDLAGAYQRVNDLRLLVVLGKSADESRPLLADRRRSGLTKPTIVTIAESAGSLANLLAQGLDAQGQARIAETTGNAVEAAKTLPDDVGQAATTEGGRQGLQSVMTAFKAAQSSVVDPLALGLGVPLGFNSLDGD